MDRTTADYMGMLATVINALALQDSLEEKGLQTRVQTAIEMRQIAEPYIRRKAMKHLERPCCDLCLRYREPVFSTDTAAGFARQRWRSILLCWPKMWMRYMTATQKKIRTPCVFDTISYMDVINKGLSVMDNTAITLCMDNHIPINVFGGE